MPVSPKAVSFENLRRALERTTIQRDDGPPGFGGAHQRFHIPTHMALAVMDVSKDADKGNDNHSSKNIVLPLVTEKLVSIAGNTPVDASTRTVRVLIEAEDGFDPRKEVKIDSLRFGSDSVVNHGGGCKPVRTEPQGRNLMVTFEGETGFRDSDFDFKLIGETLDGELIVGYALLPQRSAAAAALITLPVRITGTNGSRILESSVENWGLEDSGPVEVTEYEHTRSGVKAVKTLALPPVAPYASAKISVQLGDAPAGAVEYELVITERSRRVPRWHRVDDTNVAVTFEGDWERREAATECFLDTEHATSSMGAAVTFTFTGNRAIVHGKIGRGLGNFDVHLDGQFIEQVRCNWGQVIGAPVYQTRLLEEAKHTLKLVKSKAENNGEVTIDAFGCQRAER